MLFEFIDYLVNLIVNCKLKVELEETEDCFVKSNFDKLTGNIIKNM